MAKVQFNIRIPQDVMDRFEDKCRREGIMKTTIMETLMHSWIEGRIVTASAFPAQQEKAGETPLNPIYYSF